MNLQSINASASPEVQMNNNNATLSWAGAFGRKPSTSGGVVWGYYGCDDYLGNTVADGTLTLTDDSDNYIVVLRSTGVVSASTATTHSTDALYARLYKVTLASGLVTAIVDERLKTNGLFAPSGTATLADGDYGDITVSSSGAALSIDNDVVTYAKMQNVSATSRIMGRKTASAGDMEELTGSDAADIIGQNVKPTECICVPMSDETTALTTGTKVTMRMPYAFTLTAVRASVTTAPTGGTLLGIDIKESGTSIFSTKPTFDASEKTTTTAATQNVISDASLADDAEMTFIVDAVGSTIAGAGLKAYLIGHRT